MWNRCFRACATTRVSSWYGNTGLPAIIRTPSNARQHHDEVPVDPAPGGFRRAGVFSPLVRSARDQQRRVRRSRAAIAGSPGVVARTFTQPSLGGWRVEILTRCDAKGRVARKSWRCATPTAGVRDPRNLLMRAGRRNVTPWEAAPKRKGKISGSGKSRSLQQPARPSVAPPTHPATDRGASCSTGRRYSYFRFEAACWPERRARHRNNGKRSLLPHASYPASF